MDTLWTLWPYAFFLFIGMLIEAKVGVIGRLGAWFKATVIDRIGGK